MMPRDSILIATFERGRARGASRAKHGRSQCPYGPTRHPAMRDAWLAGYDFGASA